MTQATFQGLSSSEAARLLAQFGPNIPPQAPRLGILAITARTLKEPMFLLLAAAATLYLAIGDLGEGLFMVAGAAASIALVVVQEIRTERTLEALKKLSEPTAHCLRDGVQVRLPARDLVPGDIILVGEGERVPADAISRSGDALIADESVLTGESAPITKIPSADPAPDVIPDPGGEHTPFLFAGALIVRGTGVAEVLRTGVRTVMGGLGASLASIESEPSPLQQRTGALVARLGAFALLFCALVIVAYGYSRGDWFQGALAGITLAIGLLPEEFPMVLAIFLALGSWRLARRNVLVRRSAVTETLGSTSILCVDKTGTLTQNRMMIVAMATGDEIAPVGAPVTPAQNALIRTALLASSQNPIDPMDRAVHALAATAEIGADGEPIESFPIRPERLAFIQLWTVADGGAVYAAKGAPEAIFQLARGAESQRQRYGVTIDDWARRGLRVLAVAHAEIPKGRRLPLEDADFSFAGLLAFEDPIRAEVPEAVAAARRAGVAVAMITGDYPATALAIAREAGIDTQAGVLSGPEIVATPPAELPEKIRDVRVFARVTPASKLALVEAFKRDGNIVAMTGDGVNDGPALAAAHIGIAMGQRGSDVAREAAHIVLLDDSFASIVAGIGLGRRIFANLRKAMTYITAIHVPIAGLALLPIVMGLPPLLLPAHVVLMELILDPTCSLTFEAEPAGADAMLKPPRGRGESLFGAKELALGFAQGLVVLLGVLSVYVIELGLSVEEPQARGVAFAALIIGNLTLALGDALPKGVSPFAKENMIFWAIALVAAAVVAASLFLPQLAALLRFESPTGAELAFATAVAIIAGGWYGVFRRLVDPV